MQTQSSQSASVEAPPRIMVVDDDRMLLRGMQRVLTSAGYEVLACYNGEEALAHVASRTLDAIITDVAMPRLGGVGLLRAVRQLDLDVPVIMATGEPSIDSAAAAVEHGAFKYLMKPVSPEQLLSTAAKAVQLHRLARLRRETLRALGDDPRHSNLQDNFNNAVQSLWPAFQPIVMPNGELFGYEALLRTDEASLPTPASVIEAAERLGALWTLGRMMRERASLAMRGVDKRLHLFLNLHPRDLGDPQLLARDTAHSAMASQIVLEVTERAPLEGLGDTRATIAQLRSAGFRIAIDDLGAGYSGLTSFVQLEPEFVKLDMSLVRDVDTNRVKQRLVQSITEVSRDLGLLVVAEAVETRAERDALLELGCDLLQGFLFGHPTRELAPPTW